MKIVSENRISEKTYFYTIASRAIKGSVQSLLDKKNEMDNQVQ